MNKALFGFEIPARGGGGLMSSRSHPFQEILQELPEALQEAVHCCVAACKPQFRPRLYISDWLEELYHEAACAACEALARYDPARGDLYEFGLLVISQRLRRFCDRTWHASRCECEWPLDEETGEEVEFEDEHAHKEMEEYIALSEFRRILGQLNPPDVQVGELYFIEGLSEREIAKRLGRSQKTINNRLKKIKLYLQQMTGREGDK